MKHIERAIALTALVIVVTLSSSIVFAQSDRQTVVSIPFNFTVGEKALPAGKYVIRRNRKDLRVPDRERAVRVAVPGPARVARACSTGFPSRGGVAKKNAGGL